MSLPRERIYHEVIEGKRPVEEYISVLKAEVDAERKRELKHRTTLHISAEQELQAFKVWALFVLAPVCLLVGFLIGWRAL